MPGATRTAMSITGNPRAVDPARFENMVAAEAIRVSKTVQVDVRICFPDKPLGWGRLPAATSWR